MKLDQLSAANAIQRQRTTLLEQRRAVACNEPLTVSIVGLSFAFNRLTAEVQAALLAQIDSGIAQYDEQLRALGLVID